METIVYKFCRVCKLDKLCSEFREKRRISKENQIKYKDVIKQYYVENQEKIIQRSIEYHKKKMELQGRKKPGRKRVINVDKQVEICNETSNSD